MYVYYLKNLYLENRLREAYGYDGTPIVLLQSTDLAVLTNLVAHTNPVITTNVAVAAVTVLVTASRPMSTLPASPAATHTPMRWRACKRPRQAG